MNRKNCLVCDTKIEYLHEHVEMECIICKGRFSSNARCEAGHYVCDNCHSEKGIEVIRDTCLHTRECNPLVIAQQIMKSPHIHMHGPEHHILTGAALLTGYKNGGVKLDFSRTLGELIIRGSQVPGKVCGFWSCCGSAISGGIFFSLITNTTPMSTNSRGLAQQATAASLMKISQYDGPRCCKRDSLLSILSMIDFVRDHLDLELEGSEEDINCSFSELNEDCMGAKCPFFCPTF